MESACPWMELLRSSRFGRVHSSGAKAGNRRPGTPGPAAAGPAHGPTRMVAASQRERSWEGTLQVRPLVEQGIETTRKHRDSHGGPMPHPPAGNGSRVRGPEGPLPPPKQLVALMALLRQPATVRSPLSCTPPRPEHPSTGGLGRLAPLRPVLFTQRWFICARTMARSSGRRGSQPPRDRRSRTHSRRWAGKRAPPPRCACKRGCAASRPA